MSEYHTTLFILKSSHTNGEVIEKVHNVLSSLNCEIEKEGTLLVFNDKIDGVEKEELYLDESMTDKEILQSLKTWEALGIIDYSSDILGVVFSVNFISVNGKELQFFDMGIPKSAFHDESFQYKYQKFISAIAKEMDVVRFCYNTESINYFTDITKQLDQLILEYDVIR
ncbi:MAG: hypothetical protein HRU26_12435 [Psychroserpens sp.]|nr:hypothetical protein [Psychroserpens sp.]